VTPGGAQPPAGEGIAVLTEAAAALRTRGSAQNPGKR
jgi:hypothetical protein